MASSIICLFCNTILHHIMRTFLFFSSLTILSCGDPSGKPPPPATVDTMARPEIPIVSPFKQEPKPPIDTLQQDTTVYENERFKDVSITRLAADQYQVVGKGKLYEATLNWRLEDGHRVLKTGFETADIGAPEFGNFSFKFFATQRDTNTKLHLILFEVNAENGKPRYELPIPLF